MIHAQRSSCCSLYGHKQIFGEHGERTVRRELVDGRIGFKGRFDRCAPTGRQYDPRAANRMGGIVIYEMYRGTQKTRKSRPLPRELLFT